MNGFGCGAEEMKGGGGLTAEADLRLQQRENNIRSREEALTRLERRMLQLQQEEEARRQENLQKRKDMLSCMERKLQQMRENAMRHREQHEKEMKRLNDKMTELEILHRSLRIREEALRIREEGTERKKKNNNTWNMGQIISTLALFSGLMLLIQIQTLVPHDYLIHIVDAFALLWTLSITTIFLYEVFETSRTLEFFRRHVERLIYMCFLPFVLYALYLISHPVDATFPCANSPPASTIIDRSALFKIVEMAKDTLSWVSAYASGDRDKKF